MFETKNYTTPKTILVAPELAFSLPVVVTNTGIDADDNGKKILYAGTPIYGDITARNTAFVKATTSAGTAGVYTLTITTAFAADETITINGVTFTCKATESVEDNQFAGVDAAAQATSLKKMITSDKYTIGGSSAAITFTQKAADASDTGITVSKTATTGAFTKETSTDPVNGSSNANAIILHTTDVTAGKENATAVIFGFVDENKLDNVVLSGAEKTALTKITFVK